jgi:hypothetical protein
VLIQDKFDLDKTVIEAILSDNFPWFYAPCSSSAKFPFMSHTAIARMGDGLDIVENSTMWPILKDALVSFCGRNDIPLKGIVRCNLNSVFAPAKFTQTDAHVDNDFDHKVVVAYLNTCAGDTLIYKKRYEAGGPITINLEDEAHPTELLGSTSPVENTAVCFDGAHYHAHKFPAFSDRRVVCVYNFV